MSVDFPVSTGSFGALMWDVRFGHSAIQPTDGAASEALERAWPLHRWRWPRAGDHAGWGKLWVFRYSIDGRRRDMGFGPARIVSLAEARTKVVSYRRMILDGIDPNAHKRRGREILYFAEYARALHVKIKHQWGNPKPSTQWLSASEAHAMPVIGEIRLHWSDAPVVRQVLRQSGMINLRRPTECASVAHRLWILRPPMDFVPMQIRCRPQWRGWPRPNRCVCITRRCPIRRSRSYCKQRLLPTCTRSQNWHSNSSS